MRRSIFACLVLCLTCLVAACAGMITAAPGFGVGPSYSRRPSFVPNSTNLFLPLNFSLRAKEKYDLSLHVEQLTDDRIRDFLSVGVRALSSEFGFDATSWTIRVTQEKPPQPEPESKIAALVDRPTRNAALDYKVVCDIKSPNTGKINLQGASTGQVALLAIDRLDSEHFDYRASFSGTLAATLRAGIGDRIFFDIDMQISIERKSRFADDKHFAAFESIDQNALQRLRQHVAEIILEAYAGALSQYGIQVERGKT